MEPAVKWVAVSLCQEVAITGAPSIVKPMTQNMGLVG